MTRIIVALLWIFIGTLYAQSQTYPAHTVRVIVPSTVGTAIDIAARLTFDKVSQLLGVPFIIENKLGSFGEIGVIDLMRSPADGYTIICAPDGPLATAPASYLGEGTKTGPYDPTQLTPVMRIFETYFVLVVRKDLPVETAGELLAYGRNHPGLLTFFSGNPSGTLGIGLLNNKGAQIVESRSFAGGEPQGHREILGGIAHGMFSTSFTAKSAVEYEKNLGSMGPTRSPFLPEVKTLDEQGFPEFRELRTWIAVFAPPGTPQEIVQKLNRAVTEALRESDVRQRAEVMGLFVSPSTPEELGVLVKKQLKTLTAIIRETGVKLK